MQKLGFIFPAPGSHSETRYISKQGIKYEFVQFNSLWKPNLFSDIYAVVTNTAKDMDLYEPTVLFWYYGAQWLYNFEIDTADHVTHSIDLFEELRSHGTIHFYYLLCTLIQYRD